MLTIEERQNEARKVHALETIAKELTEISERLLNISNSMKG